MTAPECGEGIDFEGATYASVFVTESDDFEAVADTAASVLRDDHDGVVLRARGNYANEVQRLADRLCDPAEVDGTPLVGPFRKESSDVVGSDKDDLEFRLFLRTR